MKIISWNMNHWPRTTAQRGAAWDYLKSLSPDYALLQETVPLETLMPSHCVHRPGGISEHRPWGSVVASFAGPVVEIAEVATRNGSRPARLCETAPGSVAVATCGHGVTLISMYGLIENGYAITTVHRLLSDLTPLFDTALGKRVVLAGDLNITTQFEEPTRGRHRNFLERLESLGLVDALDLERPPRQPLANCPCGTEPCRHVRTLRHSKSAVPWQNDYIYVSRQLRDRVKACYPIDGGKPDPWELSDHCPVVLELEDESPPVISP